MPLTALLLVLTAATLHTSWNLIFKRVTGKHLFTWWALLVGALVFLPLLVIGPPVPRAIWPYAIASAGAEAAYFITLIRAYDKGDFSLVYPLARGVAPALLTLWAIVFLGEHPRPAGFAGLALLLLGVIVVGGGSWWLQRRRATAKLDGLGAALSVALFISIYSAIDGAAVRIMAPAAYTVLITGLTAVCLTPVVLVRYGYRSLIAAWRADWISILAVGILMLLTYMLVLQAYALGSVSYAGALREISIVLAALVGWFWLNEPFGSLRTGGALLMFGGLLLIAVAG